MKVEPIVSRGEFYAIATVLAVPFWLVGAIVAGWAKWRWGLNPLPIGGFGTASYVAGIVLADAILKRRGRSASGRETQIRERSLALPEGTVGPDDIVELHPPRSTAWFLIGLCLVLSLILGLIVLYATEWRFEWQWWVGLAMALVFGGLSIYGWWELDEPQARADASGLLAYPMGMALRRRLVRWEDVASCELITHYAPWGEVAHIQPRLLDARGTVLLDANLAFIPLPDQERLVKYIQAKLPKSRLDPWEV